MIHLSVINGILLSTYIPLIYYGIINIIKYLSTYLTHDKLIDPDKQTLG